MAANPPALCVRCGARRGLPFACDDHGAELRLVPRRRKIWQDVVVECPHVLGSEPVVVDVVVCQHGSGE
eukprot:7538327-Pyramimonas_sp.AAC.1